MVYDNKDFDYLQPLVDSFKQIRDEALNAKHSAFQNVYDEHQTNGQWNLYVLWQYFKKNNENCKSCPFTSNLLKDVPNLYSAAFAALAPDSHLLPHRGKTPLIRFHLGLTENENAFFTVNNHKHYWKGGSLIGFDNTDMHEAVNKGSNRRLILALDFNNDKKEKQKKLESWANKLIHKNYSL
tara:strand:+ start:206 stop:751 length:546 start_codon:yes stop_codon:yes gene_type:complete